MEIMLIKLIFTVLKVGVLKTNVMKYRNNIFEILPFLGTLGCLFDKQLSLPPDTNKPCGGTGNNTVYNRQLLGALYSAVHSNLRH